MSESPKAVYQEKFCKSEIIPCTWTNLQDISNDVKNGWIVFWQHHQISLGKIKKEQIEWLTEQPISGNEHLVRIRAFNLAMEYHFWRSGNQIKGRKRIDVLLEPLEISFVDTKMILRPELAKPLKGIYGDKIAVVTRNYIGYENPEVPQAGYVDSRFVEFSTL